MKIERYELRGVLGEGAMGRVYLAWDPKFSREVALKTMRDEMLDDERARRWFHREARAMAQLQHPGIVEVHDYSGPDANIPFLVMERLHGHTLTDLVRARGPAPSGAIVELATQLGRALAHAHATGIVHRDLKPDNVFVEPPARIVLTDFGLARAQLNVDLGASLASTGTNVVGTPLYLAPEVIHDPNSAGPKSDIYAVGVLLYFFASRKLPFFADDPFQTLSRVLSGAHVKVASLRPDLPSKLSEAIEQTFAPDPKMRPENGDALVAGFSRAVPGLDTQAAFAEFVRQQDDLSLFSEATQIGRPARVRQVVGALPQTQITPAPRRSEDTQVGSQDTQIVSTTNVITAPARARAKEPRRWPMPMAVVLLLLAVGAGFWLTVERRENDAVVQVAAPDTQVVTLAPREQPAPPAPVPLLPALSPPPPPTRTAPTLAEKTNDKLPEKPTDKAHNKPPTVARAKIIVAQPPGTLKVNTGAVYADIMINGEKRGSTPIHASVDLLPGHYTVLLINPDFGTHEYQVTIESGQTKVLKAALDH